MFLTAYWIFPHWNFKLSMPKSEISNFSSKLHFSLFTISIHQAPTAAPLTPSFPNALSSNHLQG